MPIKQESFHSLTRQSKDGFLSELSQRLVFSHEEQGGQVRYSQSTESYSTYSSSYGEPGGTHIQQHQITYPEDPEVLDLYYAIQDYTPSSDEAESISLVHGQMVEVLDSTISAKRPRLDDDESPTSLLSNSAARHKIAVRPHRKHADPRQRGSPSPHPPKGQEEERWLVRTRAMEHIPSKQGYVPASLLSKKKAGPRPVRSTQEEEDVIEAVREEIKAERDALVTELVETEEEYIKDVSAVLKNYCSVLDLPSTPRKLQEYSQDLFSTFKQIVIFHSGVLIEGLKYYAKENPKLLGQAFLRLERDFDKHAKYCQEEPKIDALLTENKQLKEFFLDVSQKLGDDKSLLEHLKLPIQRINDYQLLLRELVKVSVALDEDAGDLENALDLMLSIPQRETNEQYLNSIQGFKGNLHKLGRLIKHDWFTIRDSQSHTKERYVFLFKARILACKVKHVAQDRSVFVLKDIIRLPEVELDECIDSGCSFKFLDSASGDQSHILLEARNPDVKEEWLETIRQYCAGIAATAHDHIEDDVQVADERVVSPYSDEEGIQGDQRILQQTQVKREIRTGGEHSQILLQEERHLFKDSGHIQHSITLEQQSIIKEEARDGGPVIEELSVQEQNRDVTDHIGPVIEEPISIKEDTTKAEAEGAISDNDQTLDIKDDVARSPSNTSLADANEIADMEGGAKPRFTRTISGLHVKPGDKTSFDCEATGEPGPMMSWLRNNLPLDDKLADRVQILSQGNAFKLVILNCKETDSGVYTARASNEHGVATCTAQLVVAKEKDESKPLKLSPHFEVRLKDTELLLDTNVTFMLMVTGNPTPKLKFYKDGKDLKQDDRVKVAHEGKNSYELIITKVLAEDAGKYSCVATNDNGEEVTEGTITVTDEKSLWKHLDSRMLKEGEEADFKWFKDGSQFDPAERFKVMFKDEEDTLALVFQHVKPEDAGLYTCVASTTSGNISCSAELTVQGQMIHLLRDPEPPSFTMDLTDTEVSQGGSAMLELKLKGFPKPQITWTKDGKEVKAGGRFRFLYEDDESMALIIKNVSEEDAGKYVVTAKNDLGESTTQGSLSVKAPPKFKSKMKDMSCMTDKPMKCEVDIEGSPKPTVQWYKDGQIIIESERIKFTQESEHRWALTIERVTMEDSGSYSVVATNPIGQMSDFFQFMAQSPPSFLKQLIKDMTADEGQKMSFEVKVQGSPAPNVKWSKDGVELKNGEKGVTIKMEGNMHTMTLDKVSRKDKGKFTCEISNEFGSVQDTGQLNVRCKPEFTQPLKPIVIKEGEENVQLVTKADATPKPKVKWYLGDVEITESRNEFKMLEEDDSYKLIIKQGTADVAGTYHCELSNQLGSTRTSASVDVSSPPKVTVGLKDTEVNEGENVTLNATLVGKPEPTIKWYKNGEEVTVDAHIKITKNGPENILKIEKLSESFSGKYELRASSEMGQTSTQCNLQVNTKPVIKSFTLTKEVVETEEVILEVVGSGTPKPKVIWKKDGSDITVDEKKYKQETSGDRFSLTFFSISTEDGGSYTCTLSNKLGEDTKDGTITVTPLSALKTPKFTEPPKNVECVKGETAKFHGKIRGNPTPDLKWQKGKTSLKQGEEYNMKIDEEGNFSMEIPNVQETHEGSYKVKAKNDSGSDEAKVTLKVQVKPEIEGLKDCESEPAVDIVLTAQVHAVPEATVSWEKDGKPVALGESLVTSSDGEQHMLIIKNAKLDDAGKYTIKAKNTLAEETKTVKLNVKTEEPRFTKKLLDKDTRLEREIVLTVTVEGIPKPKVTWTKDGTEVVSSDDMRIEVSEDKKTHTLVLASVKEAELGKYAAAAKNMVGSAETSCDVSLIKEPPTIQKKLEGSLRTNEGQQIILEAKVDGSPPPTIKWLKDGEEVVPGGRIEIKHLRDGTCQLIVNDCLPEHAGSYKFVAINSSGKSASECEVNVKPTPRKPSFDQELKPTEAVEGKGVKLQAKVIGYPKPTIKWMKDGHVLLPSDRAVMTSAPDGTITLELEDVKPEDAGKYSLHASNDKGEQSTIAPLTVQAKPSAPVFLRQLKNVKAVEGFPVRLETQVKGNPTPEVTWSKDGVEIMPDKEKMIVCTSQDGTVSLSIPKTEKSDNASFSVIATNSEGKASTSATVVVQGRLREGEPESKPAFRDSLKDSLLDEGNDLRLSAPIIGNPLPDVNWFKDDEPLDLNDRIISVFDGDKVGLIVKGMKMDDVGTYKCVLSNPLGEGSSEASVQVRKIYQAPEFTQKFHDLQQMPTFDAKFVCRVSGIPSPDLHWDFDGMPISESPKYKIKKDGDLHVLYVKDCRWDDSGTYKATASNVDGKASCSAELQVVDEIENKPRSEAPSFMKRIGDCEVYEAMQAKFTACMTGHPEPEVEWFRDDDRLHASGRIRMEKESNGLLRLIINIVGEQDLGRYRLRIFNEHGSAECAADLKWDSLDLKPRRPIGDTYVGFEKYSRSGVPLPLPDKPIISGMTDRHLTLSWKPSIPIGPRVPVTYVIEMCEVPEGDWFPVRAGVRGCVCEVRNLIPFQDYKFRVRVENKYGISDPSPYAITYREKLVPDLPPWPSYLPPGMDFRPETSPYFPKDFDMERPPHEPYTHAPRFLRQESDTQYGVKNQPASICWYVYGYPKPKMSWLYNGEPIEGKYDTTFSSNGQATLFINRMLERDEGMYEAIAVNEHGEARQRLRVKLAVHPHFIQHLDETSWMMRRDGKLECRIEGTPFPDIKWYRNWQPLGPSTRIKMVVADDRCILHISDVMARDEGLYSISARNVAGMISSSVMVRVEETEEDYAWSTYYRLRPLKYRTKMFEDFYDIGDELGRGTQGVTYHAVDRHTGNSFAAKVMHGSGELRQYMLNELDIMSQLSHRHLTRLCDSFQTDTCFTIVSELCGGGSILDYLTKTEYITEIDVAYYIRQVLWGLEYMHSRSYGHMGLTLGDILLTRPNGMEIKLCDFGLSRKIISHSLHSLDFGVPEFVAPEVALGRGVGLGVDMWSLGIITYILLTGVSPFRGEYDRETLNNLRNYHQISFDSEHFTHISDDAKDFLRRLLCFDVESRMDVFEALKHRWLKWADTITTETTYKISTERLRQYYIGFRDWYRNASCRTWFRRRPLSGADTDPSKMVYPPDMSYTPPPTTALPSHRPTKWEGPTHTEKLHEDWEIPNPESESHYQQGPDTYLLQLRDVDFPARIRRYMKVASERSATFRLNVAPWQKNVMIRERRKFTDIMDEEIDDEKKNRMAKYEMDTQTHISMPRRLRTEVGVRLDAAAEAEAMKEGWRKGSLPFFREKIHNKALQEDKVTQVTCLAVGDPKPDVQWFRNDMLITSSKRVYVSEGEKGRSVLTFNPTRPFDAGVYKAIARNDNGQTECRARLVVGDIPGVPDMPEIVDVSSTDILVKWKQLRDDGNSPILCYCVDYREVDATEWIMAADNIDHEFYCIHNLKPDTSYQVRMAGMNKFGWGTKSCPSEPLTTKPEGGESIHMSKAMAYLQEMTDKGRCILLETHEDPPDLDYDIERNPIPIQKKTPLDRYNFIAEVSRGRFCFLLKCSERKRHGEFYVAKIMPFNDETEDSVMREYTTLSTMAHERLATLHEVFHIDDCFCMIMERLQGYNILQYLTHLDTYTEDMVATVIRQVMDGVQYLHWKGVAHLNLQPDNIVLTTTRNMDVKIIDLSSVQKVTKLGVPVIPAGPLDYMSPEVLYHEDVTPASDVWQIGVLMYVLLSGTAPFRGETDEETRINIQYVRYRFEPMFKNVTSEATRFLMLLFKRHASKRPTVDECLEHRWFHPTEYMQKKREKAVFCGNDLEKFSKDYHHMKAVDAAQNDKVLGRFGMSGRRPSIVHHELYT